MRKTQKNDNNHVERPSTFSDYIAKRSAHNERLISQAVSMVDASRFGNLTDYCKSISAIVSEIRTAKALESSSPFHRKIVKPLSYTTIMRNSEYRKIVEHRFNETRELALMEHQEDVEDLKLKIASLHAQSNLLKEKIQAMDTGRPSGTVVDSEYQTLLEKANSRIGLLLTAYKNMRENARGVFKVISEPTEERPVPGLYSYSGLVICQDEIDKISDIARDHPIQP
ncbi:hypothetical protein [Pseudomonas sp. KCJK8751]|uniref:hypothetical protein n=1 Tax=Pseudomonas sp. KCJK8751 TaxID=3344564 RepID=UPI003906080A